MPTVGCEADAVAFTDEVEVHHEQQVAKVFNGGKELCGCGGGMAPFATQAPLSEAELSGDWQLAGPGASFSADADGLLQMESLDGAAAWLPQLEASAPGVLRLPLGVWVRIANLQGELGGLLLQAGTVLAPGLRSSAAARYSQSGSLEALVFLREART
ncbi:hypothetical protein WJX81_004259 [Elliptochloris bilobata]|uniref:Plastid lipid-associated protein/fibrillin conserved domain-containing protein n=1 Tax=Elliptochloris bilobata TaxID=381761 RepID=A0AAW1QWE8_9CHLO